MVSLSMAYRDEVDRVLRENDEIRQALAKARGDARVTAFRQVLLAFAFGLSWSVLGDDANAHAVVPYEPPPSGLAWLEVRPFATSTSFTIDERTKGSGPMRLAVHPGAHRIRFLGVYGDHCAMVNARAGESVWAIEGEWRCP